MNIRKTTAVVTMAVLMAFANQSMGQWVENGVAVGRTPFYERSTDVCRTSDGDFVTARLYSSNIFMQRHDAWGRLQGAEIQVSLGTFDPHQLQIVGDGNGGFFLIYVRHFDDGAVDWQDFLEYKRFDSAGSEIGSGTFSSSYESEPLEDHFRELTAVADGTGGCTVAWTERLAAGADYLKISRIRSYGNILWTNTQGIIPPGDPIELVSDGAGGATIGWVQYDNVFVNRYTSTGTSDWGVGVELSTSPYPASEPSLASWGQGVAVVWTEMRTDRGTPDGDTAFLLVDKNGTFASSFAYVDSSTNDTSNPDVIGDGTGEFGAVWQQGTAIIWNWWRNGAWKSTAIGAALGAAENPRFVAVDKRFDQWDGEWWVEVSIICQASGLGGARNVSVARPYRSLYGTSGGIRVPDRLTDRGLDTYSPVAVSDGDGGLIAVWHEETDNTSFHDAYVQRFMKDGYWGYPSATVVSALDIPSDQGGYVNLTWDASRLQGNTYPEYSVESYGIWRSISETKAKQLLAAGAPVSEFWSVSQKSSTHPTVYAETQGDKTIYWEFIWNYYAPVGVTSFAHMTQTVYDSVGTDSALHQFQVTTHTYDSNTGGYRIYPSGAISGYSVDNLAPTAPLKTQAAQSYEPLGVTLAWSPNAELDVQNYVVHAGASAEFVPDLSNLVATTADTTTFLANHTWGAEYYKVAARDVHDNTGAFTAFSAGSITAVELPTASMLAMTAYPNPFNPMTTISYSVPQNGNVRLQIYDTMGRLVRTLVEESMTAGQHEVAWQGRDTQGKGVASGVYFLRLDNEGVTVNQRITLVR